MLFYAVVFIVLGVIFKLILSEKILYPAIIITAILWAFAFGPWAILTFFELLLGVTIVESVKSNTDINSKNTESNKNTSPTRKDYLTPTSRRNIVAKESSSPIKDDNFDIDIKKLNVAYTKELNKNSW